MKDEKTILSQCLKKDPKAEFALYDLYKVQMMGICRRYAIDSDHALEIFQEGFIQVFESLHTFRSQSSLKTWMSRIFIYTAISYLRKQKKYKDLVRLDIIFNQVPLEETEEDEDLSKTSFENDPQVVLDCMATLPENYRLVLNLFAIDEMSHAQISRTLGISESHSRVLLTRARKMLTGILIKKKHELKLANN